MPFVGTGHIWMLAILGVIAVIIFGPGKLPELGSGFGRAIREFRQATSGAASAPAKTVESGTGAPADLTS